MAPAAIERDSTLPAWARFLWETPWLWLALVIALFCVPLFIGLDNTDLDSDEAIYSFAVETMLEDGDWLTPKSIPSGTSAFLEKPPLKFWLTALPIRLGMLPENEFGLRFMDAVFGALAFLYVFAIGRRLAGPLCGFVAVLLLFAQNALLYQHGLRSNNMESTTLLAYAAGVYHFLAWRSVNPDVKRHVYAMSLWFVFAFMTKFVAALFLPVILGAAALLKHEDRGRLYRDWPTFLLAALLAVALIAPWFVYEYFERGPRLFEIMFDAHVKKRFTAYLDKAHLQPWHFYLTHLWSELGVAGMRLLVGIAGVLFVARSVARRWTEGIVVVLWFAIPVAVISTGTSKLYHYIYPFLPPVALAGGWLVATVLRRIYPWFTPPLVPAKLIAGAAIAGALVFVLPLGAYRTNVAQASELRRPHHDLRACLAPIVDERVAQGRGAPGVLVDSGAPSWVPIYYFRTIGELQRGTQATDETLVGHLASRTDSRPIMLSTDRYREFLSHLARDRTALSGQPVGVVVLGGETVLLPGPYAACGADQIQPVR